MKETIRIMGIDPSLRNTGIAVADYNIITGVLDVIHLGIVKTEKFAGGVAVRATSDDLRCARAIVGGLRQCVTDYNPVMAVTEISSFSQSARGMFTNGVCCGVIASMKIPIIEVNALEVKSAAGGVKTSSKQFMIEWAVSKWPNAGWFTRKFKGKVELTNDNEHVADACAAIAAGLLTPQFSQAVEMMKAIHGDRIAA